MQFIKFIFNTLKKFMVNIFHSFYANESKKDISWNSFINNDLKLRVKNEKNMVSTLETMFKWSCYVIFLIYRQYIKSIHDKLIFL